MIFAYIQITDNNIVLHCLKLFSGLDWIAIRARALERHGKLAALSLRDYYAIVMRLLYGGMTVDCDAIVGL